MSDVLNGDLISEAEVAQILSVHVKTLRRWHRELRAPKRIRIGQKNLLSQKFGRTLARKE
jgi:hypothetical protein